ncbi:GtrA family protein [Pseudomonas sp. CFII64]|uniref:GtrA family protein n=1 Tax=Pseudomonas sp. CFII64 TaxID=911242 RepID=UPI000A061581|nr:GtrA family protein [Pseudomonas sp. CFII64]
MDTLDQPSAARLLLKRTLRFGVTGLFVTGVHFVIATLIIHYVLSNPSIANGIAFCCATMLSYLLHTVWSFSAKLHGKTLFRFVVVSIVGLLLSLTIPLGVQYLGFSALISTCAVIFLLPPVNFILHNFWTYK